METSTEIKPTFSTYICECGSKITGAGGKSSITKHNKTSKHKLFTGEITKDQVVRTQGRQKMKDEDKKYTSEYRRVYNKLYYNKHKDKLTPLKKKMAFDPKLKAEVLAYLNRENELAPITGDGGYGKTN